MVLLIKIQSKLSFMANFTRLFFLASSIFVCPWMWGQMIITSTTPVTQNFDGMGTSATASLPSGFRISQGTVYANGLSATNRAYGTSGTNAVSAVSAGGAVNWANGVNSTATDRALGFLSSNTYTSPRSIMLEIENNTGGTITELNVSFNYEKYRNGSREFNLTFFHGSGGGTWTAAAAGNQNYPADAGNTVVNPATSISKSFTITGLSISNNSKYYFRWAYTGVGGSTNGQGIGLDNVSVSATFVAGCIQPTLQASAGSVTNPTTSSLTLNYTRGNGSGVMVVSQANSPTIDPTNGVAYTVGNNIGGGTVIFRGAASGTNTATSLPVNSLNPQTQYFFDIYEYSATNCYRHPRLSVSGWTYSLLPTAHAASFNCTAASTTQINLTYPAASTIPNGAGYLILQKTGSAPTGLPLNGVQYAPGNAVGDATVAAVVNNVSTSQSITSLAPSTNYYFSIIPYNWDSVNVQTYNYRTAATIPVTNCTTQGITSSVSDIVDAADISVYTSDINYLQWQSNNITNTGTGAGGSVGVFRFIIRDGGAGSPDPDLLPTILTGAVFNYTGAPNTIRAAAIFNGANLVAQGTVAPNSISFSGMSGALVTAADNGTQTLTLHVTFNTSVTDRDKLVFSIASATAGAANQSSQFTEILAQSDNNTGNNRNRIQVAADRLQVLQQPTTTSINAIMTPEPAFDAVDVNGNKDIDFVGNVTITSTGTMTGSPITAAASAGTAIFGNVVHTAVGNSLTLGVTSPGLIGLTSAAFDIVSNTYVNGDYRTIGSGSWLNNSAAPAIWERLVGGVWTTSNSPAYNTSNNVYIQNGHTITSGGGFGNNVNLKLLSGGTFVNQHVSTARSVYIYEGGVMQVNNNLTISSTGYIEVEDGGRLNLNHAFTDPATSIWNGAENFHPQSDVVIQNWNNQTATFFIPSNTAITANVYNGSPACFGHLTVDMSASANTVPLQMFPDGFNRNLCHGNFILQTSAPSASYALQMISGGSYTTEIGGNFLMNNGFVRPVHLLVNAGMANITLEGDLIKNSSGSLNLCLSDAVGTNILMTVEGDIHLQNGDLNLNAATGGTNAVSNILSLKGDLMVATTGRLLNSYPFSNGSFHFSNIGDGLSPSTTQTIDIATTLADENSHLSFYIKNGAYVQQINRNFELGTNSGVIVEPGAVFDFGFDANTALLTNISGAQTGTFFTSQQGSTLKITSPEGITTTVGQGNVQVEPANRTYNQTAYFHYIGKQNQVTGDGLINASTGKMVMVELADNALTLTPTNSVGISNANTLDIAGGRLEIRQGTVLGSNAGDFFGSGYLVMFDGEYRISTITASPLSDHLPQLVGYTVYTLTGGTISLVGNEDIQILSSIPVYHNLTFGGTNTLGANYKGISGPTTVMNLVTITGTPVVDVQSNPLGGNAGLTMDGGRFRSSRVDVEWPELLAAATPYNITGGTVELYGSTLLQHQILRGGINYFNVELNAASANFTEGNVWVSGNLSVTQAMVVNAPAVFRLNPSDVISGNGTFTLESGAGLFYGHLAGISLLGATGNIQVMGTRTFSTGANYAFIGSGNMISGTGLPNTVNRLMVKKANSSNQVTLTNSVRVRTELLMEAGDVITLVNTLELGISTVEKGILEYISGHVVGMMKRWFSGTNVGEETGLFPLGLGGYDRFVMVEYTGTPPVVGGSLTANFVPMPMGVLGLPINNIPAVGSCSEFDVTNTATEGYWQMNDGDGLSGGNYDITLVGENFMVPYSLCELTALKRVLVGPWMESGNHTQPTGTIARPIVRRTSASGWSNWGFGSGPVNPLPVELISFTGNCADNEVILDWATASELNSDRFVVEKSADLQTYEYITFVSAAGNSNQINHYQVAVPRAEQLSYFRLRQEDYDGQYEYFGPISVSCANDANWLVYMSSNILFMSLPGANMEESMLNIVDMNGKTVYSQNMMLSDMAQTADLSMLNPGLYLANISSSQQAKTYKVVVTN